MSILKRIDKEIYIDNLFGNLAKKREISVVVQIGKNKFEAKMIFQIRKNNEPILKFVENIINLKNGDEIEINFMNKEMFFLFKTKITGGASDFFQLEKPIVVFSSFRRTIARYEIKEENIFLCEGSKEKALPLLDISAKGISCIADDRNFEVGQKLRDININLGENGEVYVDLLVKHCKKNSENKLIYGLTFLNTEWKTYSKILLYIIEKLHPELKYSKMFSEEEIFGLYKQSDFLKNLCFDSKKSKEEYYQEFLKKLGVLRQISDEPSIGCSMTYEKNGKMVALGSVLRVYRNTIVGQNIISVPNTKINPKANLKVAEGLADFMLNNPFFKYFINYITSELNWNRDINFEIDEIINNDNIFIFDKLQFFQYDMSLFKGGNNEYFEGYELQVLDDTEEFIKYCKDNLKPLEVDCYDYGNLRLDFCLYMGFHASRRMWSIVKVDKIYGYVVAEVYPNEFSTVNIMDNCRIFLNCIDEIYMKEILKIIIPKVGLFYKQNEKFKFNVLLKSMSNIAKAAEFPGLEYKTEMCRVIMNKYGMAEYKKLLMDNYVNYNRYYELTHPQLSIWFTEKVYPNTSFGNINSSVRFFEEIDYITLENAINLAIEKNDGIRLRMLEEDGSPRQYVSKYENLKINYIDFSGENAEYSFTKWSEANNMVPFNLIDTDLFEFTLFKINAKEGGFYSKIHHLVSDAWTVVLFEDNVVEYYSKLKQGIKLSIRKKPSYINFIQSEQEFLESEIFFKQKKYWEDKFNTLPQFTNIKPPEKILKNTKAERKSFTLTRECTSKIHKYCEEKKVSAFTFFLAILYIYINRTTEKEDIVFGTPILNRSNAKAKEIFGMFISIVPLRMRVEPNITFNAFIEYISKEWKITLKNQKYPYDLILKDFREKLKTRDNIFDITMSFQNAAQKKEENLEHHEITWHHNRSQTDSLDIHISDRNCQGAYDIDIDYLISVFSAVDIEVMWVNLSSIIDDVIRNPLKKIYELDLMTSEEKNKLLYAFNDTTSAFPKDITINKLIEIQVEKTPNNIAVVSGNKKLTYKELNEEANRMAWMLKSNKIEPGFIVGILMEASIEMFVSILAVLKSGATYLPIDPNYPEERIIYMLTDSNAIMLLTDVVSLKANVKFEATYLINSMNFNKYSKENPENINNSKEVAYIIYTSGSTGRPKGVMIEHKSLVNLCFWHIRNFSITEMDRSTKYAGVGFDASVWEIFPYFISGAAIHVIEKQLRYDIKRLNQYFNDNLITISFLPTQICEGFIELDNHSLRYLLTGADKLNKFIKNKYQLVNNYGPTENTVVATSFIVDKNYSNIPIGRPIQNTRIYILGKNNSIQPIGMIGQLYIAGEGLAKGYINGKELDEKSFINGDFVKEERLYRTGDLARWLWDGNIEFLGRVDNQVKIKGYRIEVGEIETCLMEIWGIKQAIVMVEEDNKGNKCLCAYYLSDIKMNLEQIKYELARKLPKYMIPEYYMSINNIPLTQNGKVDRMKLPKISVGALATIEVILPENYVERVVIETLKNLVSSENIGINHNLFDDLGCDSLTLVKMIVELQEKNIKVSMQDFYEYPIIKNLGEKIMNQNKNREKYDKKIYFKKVPIISSNYTELEGKEEFKYILLTGVTGFLGIHILNKLMLNSKVQVTCIIRGYDMEEAQKRLLETWEFYFPNLSYGLFEDRINVIRGDLSEEKLGMTDDEYLKLGNKLSSIINPAGLVKHYGEFKEFMKANIIGVQNLILLSKKYNLRYNHISTISISGNYKLQNEKEMIFSELDFFIGQDISDNPYVKSKFEAESIVLKAIKEGINCTILRVGNLTGRYDDGHFQKNIKDNRFYNLLKAFITTKTIPYSMIHQEIDLTPVDECSSAIVALICQRDTRNYVYHIYNNKTVRLKDLVYYLWEIGFSIEVLKDSEFMKFLNEFCKNSEDYEILKGLTEILSQGDKGENGYTVTIKSDITTNRLQKEGFNWMEVDINYIKKIIGYINSIGFIPEKDRGEVK